jgi:hypothetical protein
MCDEKTCGNEIKCECMEKTYKFSDQSIGTLMMCLQKCLLTQEDIVPMLKNLSVVTVDGEIKILNPPAFEIDNEILEEISKKS